MEHIEKLERPNLVLILVDTLRADFTTPYGDVEGLTPELSRWASNGVLFERTRSQSSWTKISMASFMTSLWPHRHGIFAGADGLSEGAVTLAETLRDSGYLTYGVQTNGWLHQSFGFHQGFDRYLFPMGQGAQGIPQPFIWSHADRVLEEGFRLIDAYDDSAPLFLYLHFMDVHQYASPPEFRAYGRDSVGLYRASVRWVDDAVERVREKLDDAGLLDNTVMLFAADHGETFGEHGVHGHARNVLTPVVWVPLVFRFPFRTEEVRISTQVRNIDIAPTLLQLAKIEIPPSFEGESLLPLIAAAGNGSSEIATDRPNYPALGTPLFPNANVQKALSDGAWTYARNVDQKDDAGKQRDFLYDRGVDPVENVNLIELEAEMAERMRARLDEHLALDPVDGVLEQGVRIDPKIAAGLRAMGYLPESSPAPGQKAETDGSLPSSK